MTWLKTCLYQIHVKEVLRLVHMVVGLFLLWFAVQVGAIVPLASQKSLAPADT